MIKYLQCYQREVPASLIQIANGILKGIKHPAAAILGKVTTAVDEVLAKYPGQKYRLTIEAITEVDDREANEEREIRAEEIR